jgi:hypothetical protein
LIGPNDAVSKASHAREDTRVVADARIVLEKGDIACVMQLVLDVPVTADRGGEATCRRFRVGEVVGGLVYPLIRNCSRHPDQRLHG